MIPSTGPIRNSLTVIVSSIHVGRVRLFDSDQDPEKPWTSGIIKQPVLDSVELGEVGLVGDEHADLVHHGGRDKAVLVYAQSHFSFWRKEFAQVEWQDGAFGENLTVEQIVESEVCIGDVFALGDCLLQISQPRQPCWKLSRRWQLPKLTVRVQETRRTGWYLRVLKTGTIAAGQSMILQQRPHPEFSVAFSNEVMFGQPRNAEVDRQLAACPLLSASWKKTLSDRSNRAAKTEVELQAKRLG